jgi:hypothetical protein
MKLIIIILVAVVFLLALVVALFFRLRSSVSPLASHDTEPEVELDASLEYEWKTKASPWSKLVIVIMVVGALVYLLYGYEELQEVFKKVYQIILVIFTVLSGFLSAMMKSFHYQMRADGLYRGEIQQDGKVKEFKQLFSWEQLLYIRPTNSGFRYHTRPKSGSMFGGISSGTVKGGDNAILVTSLVMSRGVPTSAPDSSEYKS